MTNTHTTLNYPDLWAQTTESAGQIAHHLDFCAAAAAAAAALAAFFSATSLISSSSPLIRSSNLSARGDVIYGET